MVIDRITKWYATFSSITFSVLSWFKAMLEEALDEEEKEKELEEKELAKESKWNELHDRLKFGAKVSITYCLSCN